jgi:transposase InsO family protein
MYTTYNRLPRIRREAVRLVVDQGWSTREVARHINFTHSAVVKWLAKAKLLPHNIQFIPTISSRPHTSPTALPRDIVKTVLDYRGERNECAQVIHYKLNKDGVGISLSSIKRILKRAECSKFSKWKKWHQYPERPMPEKPGLLVEIDTIHDGPQEDRLYIYTLEDVCSRWAHAWATDRINTYRSLSFVSDAKKNSPFNIFLLQSDHGPEFSRHFSKMILVQGIEHRHTRIRRPTDNGHLERFNRTIQEKCLAFVPRNLKAYQKAIPEFLDYYNTKRPHMGLNMQTPLEVLRKY